MKFTTQFKPSISPYSVIEGISMTIPDDAMSLQTMLLQFSRGMTPAVVQQGHYMSDELGRDVDFDDSMSNDFDLSDISDNAMRIQMLKEAVEAEKAAKKERIDDDKAKEA